MKFPLIKLYAKIEKRKNISINTSGYEEESPYRIYTSKKILKNMLICYYYQTLKNYIIYYRF